MTSVQNLRLQPENRANIHWLLEGYVVQREERYMRLGEEAGVCKTKLHSFTSASSRDNGVKLLRKQGASSILNPRSVS